MARVVHRFLLALLLLVVAYGMGADLPDWHLSSSARSLYLKSAFVHGYIHGYEQGFHNADLDLQMGRPARDPAKIKQFQNAAGYRDVYGDKRVFEVGYREGFRVGYADSYGGRHFRAVTELDEAAAGLGSDDGAGPSREFDQGIFAGYSTGRQQGLRDGRAGAEFNLSAVRCHGGIFHPFRRGDEYCDGYGRGYRLGYSDGYSNQAPKALAQGK